MDDVPPIPPTGLEPLDGEQLAAEALAAGPAVEHGKVVCPHGGCVLARIIRTPAGLVAEPSRQAQRDRFPLLPVLISATSTVDTYCKHGFHRADAALLRQHFAATTRRYPASCVSGRCIGSASGSGPRLDSFEAARREELETSGFATHDDDIEHVNAELYSFELDDEGHDVD